jgi:hypothetical protein
MCHDPLPNIYGIEDTSGAEGGKEVAVMAVASQTRFDYAGRYHPTGIDFVVRSLFNLVGRCIRQ